MNKKRVLIVFGIMLIFVGLNVKEVLASQSLLNDYGRDPDLTIVKETDGKYKGNIKSAWYSIPATKADSFSQSFDICIGDGWAGGLSLKTGLSAGDNKSRAEIIFGRGGANQGYLSFSYSNPEGKENKITTNISYVVGFYPYQVNIDYKKQENIIRCMVKDKKEDKLLWDTGDLKVEGSLNLNQVIFETTPGTPESNICHDPEDKCIYLFARYPIGGSTYSGEAMVDNMTLNYSYEVPAPSIPSPAPDAKPDISISVKDMANADLALSKVFPKENEKIEIRARVHNLGNKDAENVVVIFFQEKPERKLIGETVIPSIYADSMETARLEYTFPTNGVYQIGAEVDPENKIKETDKTNNKTSLEVSVVVKDIYIDWYRPGKACDSLHFFNIASGVAGVKRHNYWLNRGVRPLVSKGVSKAKDITPENIAENWGDAAKAGFKGIAIDEFGFYEHSPGEESNRKALTALKKVKEEHPDLFIYAWVAGPLNSVECESFLKGADLIGLETYLNYFRGHWKTHSEYRYFDYRIEFARNADILLKTIPAISISPEHGGITPENMEDQFRYIRKQGPEMPGVFFYGASRSTLELKKIVDKFCYQYFIAPLLTLWPEKDVSFSNYQPKKGENVEITATIHNIGAMDSRKVAVNFYDGDPRSTGKLIGAKEIKSVPAGQETIPWGEDKKGKSILPMGRSIVKINYQPVKAGYRGIYVGIMPAGEDTVLDGLVSKTILVKEK